MGTRVLIKGFLAGPPQLLPGSGVVRSFYVDVERDPDPNRSPWVGSSSTQPVYESRKLEAVRLLGITDQRHRHVYSDPEDDNYEGT
jgi:hypothetical protein